jgi:hypothetical protein
LLGTEQVSPHSPSTVEARPCSPGIAEARLPSIIKAAPFVDFGGTAVESAAAICITIITNCPSHPASHLCSAWAANIAANQDSSVADCN